jgi:DNA-binding SARP family transcriptional activator
MNQKSPDPNIMHVQFFKQFVIHYKSKTLIPRTQMPLRRSALLGYLVMYHRNVCSISTLSVIFCPQSKKPEGALRNLIYRIRQTLSDVWPDENFILSRSSGYQWNPDIPMQLDTETFDVLCTSFHTAKGTDTQINLGLKLFHLYQGDFDETAQSNYDWILQKAAYYQGRMIETLKVLIDKLRVRRRGADVEMIAVSAMQRKYPDETFHQKIILAFLSCGFYTQAASYCHWLIDFLTIELEIEPSDETFQLQADVMAAASPRHNHSLRTLLIDLDTKAAAETNAIYCERGIFDKIYAIAFNQVQYHIVSCYLILITLDTQNVFKHGLTLNAAMAVIKAHLPRKLRICDVYTQYAFNQFLILSPVKNKKEAVQISYDLEHYLEKYLGKEAYSLEMMPLSCA